MKTTLSKFAAASVAGLAVLGSTAMVEPASAVVIGTTCSTADFSPEATACKGQFSGPITTPQARQDFLNELNGGLFNTLDTTKFPWLFDSKTDAGGTDDKDPNILDITLTGIDGQSGTVSFANLNTQLTNLVLVPFGGNRYSAYYFEAGTYDVSSFEWSTAGLQNQGGQQPNLSNFNVFTQTIPTPALLPGLIGMGAAALRKRKGEGDESAEA